MVLSQFLKLRMRKAPVPSESVQQEQKPYSGESISLRLTSTIAMSIFGRLKILEGNHPYLKTDYPEYAAVRQEIADGIVTPPEDRTELGVLYDKMRELLHHISDERNAKVSSDEEVRRLIPRNYLPMSFDLLLEDFMEMQSNEQLAHSTIDAVEDVLFGDRGIEEINTTHRERIRAKVMKALVYDYGHAEKIREDLAEAGDENVFRLLKLNSDKLKAIRKKNGLEPLPPKDPEGNEHPVHKVALIILRTREQISHNRKISAEPSPV